MADLFLSYSRKDSRFARRLADDLEKLGVDVWIDLDDIRPGTGWTDAIQQALEQCRVMVVIVSPDSMQSRAVADEWAYFSSDLNKPVIALVYRKAQIPYVLARQPRTEAAGRDYDAVFHDLHAELRRTGIRVQDWKPPPQPGAKPKNDGSPAEMLGCLPVLLLLVLAYLALPLSNQRDHDDPVWAGNDQLIFTVDNGESDLYLVAADGKHYRRLTGNSGADTRPLPSPDGRYMLFSSNRSGLGDDLVVADVENWTASPITDVQAGRVIDGTFFGWSPDSRWIGFGSYEGITVVDAATGEAVKLVQAGSLAGDPQWSPAENVIAFTSYPDDPFATPGYELETVEVLTGAARTLSGSGESRIGLSSNSFLWSPDGTQLAFMGGGSIYTVSSAGGSPPQPILQIPYGTLHVWTQGSDPLLIYRVFDEGDDLGPAGLRSVSLQDGTRQRLIDMENDAKFNFSSDKLQIVQLERDTEKKQITVTIRDVLTSSQHTYGPFRYTGGIPSRIRWSPNRSAIAFDAGYSPARIYVIDLEANRLQNVTRRSLLAEWLALRGGL